MPTLSTLLRRLAQCTLSASLVLVGAAASAHGFQAGNIVIEHPYALPSPPGSPNGAMYLRALRNTGEQADKLLSARTPVAASVEIHHMQMDSGNVMRMRAVDGLPLAPKAELKLMHGGEWHLMLLSLKRPLKVGDHFPVTLRFERGGEQEVSVWVQAPRDLAAATPADDVAAITHLLMATFDKPEARLAVAPVVVQGDQALAGWTQGERGGRALLQRHHGAWQVAVCGGDGLTDPRLLANAGLAAAEARALVASLTQAEARLPPAQRAKFSTFDGLVRMDAAGHHPPSGAGPHPAAGVGNSSPPDASHGAATASAPLH